MTKITTLLKKTLPVVLALVIVFAAVPFTGASAAGLDSQANAQSTYPRLELIWMREQAAYQREDKALSNATAFISKVQALLDKATAKGLDVTSIQTALNALSSVLPAVQSAHAPGAAIISGHAGFDANGNVTDPTTAIATVKSLAQVLKDTRTAMNGTLKALRQSVRDFRQAHPHTRPATAPAATPTP
ncbi:MAG TPA: hypothetical protein VMT91_01755 [Anaerolineales bacterium]|nr:hypothetical protein [Anaerolineales bacterium]